MREFAYLYSVKHDIHLDLSDWKTSLIMLAIPYAKFQVSVVSSNGYKIPAAVRIEANKHQVHINQVTARQFKEGQLRRLRKQYTVLTEDTNGMRPVEGAEDALGDDFDEHIERLPRELRKQAMID